MRSIPDTVKRCEDGYCPFRIDGGDRIYPYCKREKKNIEPFLFSYTDLSVEANYFPKFCKLPIVIELDSKGQCSFPASLVSIAPVKEIKNV